MREDTPIKTLQNAFLAGDADAVGEVLLSSMIGEPARDAAPDFFRAQAAALAVSLAPVLVWMRDHKGVALNIDTLRLSFELRSIWKVAAKRVFAVRDSITGETTDISVPEMPEDFLYPLQEYLGELPFFDTSLDWSQQKTPAALRQHSFAQYYVTQTFPLVDPGTPGLHHRAQ
jgi:intracellular multiplication protein IcmO